MKTLRTVAAVAAALALLASAPVRCPCVEPPTNPAAADGHDCCAPPTGVSTVGPGCCEPDAAALPDGLAAGAATGVPGPAPADSLLPSGDFAPTVRLASRTALLAPSPPAILRI